LTRITPFGTILDGRTFSSAKYRYGFNGKESDSEVKGAGNSYDFGARIYDSRLGRFLTLDPLQTQFSDYSPYIYGACSPILEISLTQTPPFRNIQTPQNLVCFSVINQYL